MSKRVASDVVILLLGSDVSLGWETAASSSGATNVASRSRTKDTIGILKHVEPVPQLTIRARVFSVIGDYSTVIAATLPAQRGYMYLGPVTAISRHPLE
jgi:hypothetical protein